MGPKGGCGCDGGCGSSSIATADAANPLFWVVELPGGGNLNLPTQIPIDEQGPSVDMPDPGWTDGPIGPPFGDCVETTTTVWVAVAPRPCDDGSTVQCLQRAWKTESHSVGGLHDACPETTYMNYGPHKCDECPKEPAAPKKKKSPEQIIDDWLNPGSYV